MSEVSEKFHELVDQILQKICETACANNILTDDELKLVFIFQAETNRYIQALKELGTKPFVRESPSFVLGKSYGDLFHKLKLQAYDDGKITKEESEILEPLMNMLLNGIAKIFNKRGFLETD